MEYDPRIIEPRVQKLWDDNRCFCATPDPKREKFYCLSMFPYPSGNLHIGHVRNYTIGDVISRYQRMLGKNVLQPMGWDAFGLPAENAAAKHNTPPSEWTRKNIRHMRKQLKRLGMAYDWDRELITCHPDYYRWEQWLLCRLLEKGLVYRKDTWVNWDPIDKTVLANEQVVDGKGWRSGAQVERRRMPQWFLRITDYADELLDGLDRLPGWPATVKTMQRNWIGRSQGVRIRFRIEGKPQQRIDDKYIEVYTTRPDTVMGVSYVGLASEHPLVERLAENNSELAGFVASCQRGPVSESEILKREKAGMDTGLRCIHPISGASVPVWCANFVLMEYGFGAVMSVPAHDERDWEFARKYDLPVLPVVRPGEGQTDDFDTNTQAYAGKGVLFNSGRYDGMDYDTAFDAIAADLERSGDGRREQHYRLRDWGISRQRAWGCPIPFRKTGEEYRGVEDEELPFAPNANGCDDGGYESDTLDTFVESSWYYARFASAHSKDAIFNDEVDYWLPVDQYIGGVEHAVLHLLYARFFHRLMRDFGLVKGDEPFTKLLSQGMVVKDGQKMSKSRGNTVDPQNLIDRYGADAVRLFVMFAAPPSKSLEWSESGIEGGYRFLKRLWQAVTGFSAGLVEETLPDADAQRGLRREIHETIVRVSKDFAERQHFNTVVAGNMKLLNEITRFEDNSESGRAVKGEGLVALLKMMSPIVPHICQSLWEVLGNDGILAQSEWPQADADALRTVNDRIVVQINGKLCSHITVPADSDEEYVKATALTDEKVRRAVESKGEPVKVIYVPKRIINLVLQ